VKANQRRPAEHTERPPIVQDVLRTAGQPLAAEIRQSMEVRFAQDFSQVRVHSDGQAATSAGEVGADAYTVGQDIVFGPGRYQPDAPDGQHLLAHELTHVLQQRDAAATESPAVTDIDHPLERQAADVAAGGHLTGPLKTGRLQLSRQTATSARNGDVAPTTLAEIQGLQMSKLLRALEMLPVGIRSDERAGQAIGGPRLVTAMRVVAAKGSDWTSFKAQQDTLLSTLPPDQVGEISAYLRAGDVGALRTAIPAIAPEDIRAGWKSRKQDFESAASDPSNTLNAAQMYQIWLRHWMDEQAAAYAEFKPLEAKTKADINAYTENYPKFQAGRRGIFSPEYEAAADRLAAANYYSSYLIGVHDWLEIAVDGMHKHVTLEQVNLQAVELIKRRETHLAVLGFVLALASIPASPRIAPRFREATAPAENVPPAESTGARTPGPAQNVLVVGAETAGEFSYAAEVAAAGQPVTVVNPVVSSEATAYIAQGGNFIRGTVQDLPLQPAYTMIREDFPFPLGRGFPPTAEFAAARINRLAPSGRWVVTTEAEEFAKTLKATATIDGARVTMREIPLHHEGAPVSTWPRDQTRFVLIIEKPAIPTHQ
jgi:hypothetical protein